MKKQLQNILTFAFVLFLATGMAYAQQGRVHAALMGGVASYGGDNDTYSGDLNLGKAYFDNAGPNLGLELGYGLTDQLTALVRGAWGKYPNIESRFAANTQKEGRLTGALLLRYQIFSALANKAFSPYVQLGANLTQASKQTDLTHAKSIPGLGYGPSLGLGVQFKVGPVKLGIDGTSYMVTPDAAIDAADPKGKNPAVSGDKSNFDYLNYLSAHLSFDLKEGVVCNPALVTNVNLPSGSVNMGQATNFSMGVAPTATVPVAYMWDFGDGNTGTGAAVTHTYARPGTYTVTSSAMNCRGTDTKTGTVTVVDPCASNPAKLSAANAPTTLEAGKSGSFTSSASGTCQVSYAWDFGNGATASTANASYSFSTPGTYTVKVTAKNAAGSDSRTFRVTVNAATPPPITDPCSKVTELNSVYFNYGASTIDAQAMSLIDENITALKDCPNLKIVVTGYSDSVENSMTIAQRRAKAIADYMTSKGIDASRITVRGAGVDPNNCDKEDPGRGCRRNRRVEAVIVR